MEHKVPRRRSKYRNTPVVVDGRRFASKREARRYGELKLLERAGEISGLELQVSYPLTVNGVKVTRYVADFRYFDNSLDRWVVEDAKGFKTPEYKIKKKLLLALKGIEIQEV